MKIVVGMATMAGREVEVEKAVNSLKDQVDDIRIYDNKVEEKDLADNGKFFFLKDYSEPIYYFSCDDDIIYPKDYVSHTIKQIKKHKCIVTYHGRKLLGLNKSYYHHHEAYHCLRTFKEDVQIDVPGTGVTAFRTDYFNPSTLYKSKHRLMSDVLFAYQAAQERKKVMMCKHEARWILLQPIPFRKTIFGTQHKSATTQRLIANEIYKLNYEPLIQEDQDSERWQ